MIEVDRAAVRPVYNSASGEYQYEWSCPDCGDNESGYRALPSAMFDADAHLEECKG